MFKISFLTVLFSFFVLPSFAQTRQIGLKAHIGFSRLTYRLPTIRGPQKGNPHFSGNLGLWREQQINKNAFWGIEFLWVQAKNTGQFENPIIEVGPNGALVQTGQLTTNETSQISYLGIPAYYRYLSGKWGYRAGLQILLPVFISTHTQMSGTYQNQPYFHESNTKEAIFNHLDIGPKIGIDYTLNNRFRLSADYYYGLVSIRTPDTIGSLSIQQLSVGVAVVLKTRGEL